MVTLVNPFPEEANFALKLVCQHKSVELDMVVDRAVKGLPPPPPSASASLGYSPIPQAPKPAAAKVALVSRAGARPPPPVEKTPEEIEIEAISKQPYWTANVEDGINLAPHGSKTILVSTSPSTHPINTASPPPPPLLFFPCPSGQFPTVFSGHPQLPNRTI